MRMAKSAVCCERCFSQIAKRNPPAAKLWLTLCDIQNRNMLPVFGVYPEEPLELQLLEEMGFLLSIDTPEMVVIKIFGLHEDSDGSYYCGGHCE